MENGTIEERLYELMIAASEATKKSLSENKGAQSEQLKCFYISAQMDIDNSLNHLKPILEYRKLVAQQLLDANREDDKIMLFYAYKKTDDIIKLLLGEL